MQNKYDTVKKDGKDDVLNINIEPAGKNKKTGGGDVNINLGGNNKNASP